jgi:hypothetical protein
VNAAPLTTPYHRRVTAVRARPWRGSLLLVVALLVGGWWQRLPALIEFSGPT